jgi:hypothetical protein
MTVDEQATITDLMQKNGFEPINSSSEELQFQKTENNESVQVTLLNDFPYYVKTQFADSAIPDRWAKQTLMLKNFYKVKTFAENDVNKVIDHLKQEFNG